MAAAQDIANRTPITAALMLATLMNTLDTTIANVALPHIQGSVSASQDEIVWVLTSYIVATAVMLPLTGWLSEKFGRKRVLMVSIAGFTAASMLCGLASSLPELVAFRVLQGIAGASLMPLSQTVLLDVYPPRLIPRVMSLWSAATMLGPILGPTLGGWLTENLSWRWVFFINLPVGALAFFLLFTFMARDAGGRQRPFDFLGFWALVALVGSVQLMLDRGPGQDWFDSPEIWAWAVTALIGFYVFVLQTATAEHPFFDRNLARDRNFVTTTILSCFVFGLMFSTTALLPSFMQNLMSYSALQSGIATVPRGFGSLIAFLALPRLIVWFGGRNVLFAGIPLTLVAVWQMSQFDLSMDVRPVMVACFIQGMGVGMLFAPLSMLAYATLDARYRPEGATIAAIMRSLGGSIGISIIQAVLVRDSALAHERLAEGVTTANPVIRAALPPLMDPATQTGLEALNAEVTRQGTMIGYANIFSWMTLSIVLFSPLVLLIRPARAPQTEVEPPVE